jgi:mono/diheme cytochrome c family protein
MERVRVGLRSAILAAVILANPVCPTWNVKARLALPATSALRTEKCSTLDLELSGDLAGSPRGSARCITRGELLALPQRTITVTGGNFSRPTQASGVALEELIERFAAHPSADLALAVCTDRYCAPYTRAYLAAHKPLLVLKIDGKSPANWPKDSDGSYMGPYLIANPQFAPSFKILSHQDEAQIPWGVVRLEFRSEAEVLAAIAPQGPTANEALVQDGYRIAQQNCFRCHNLSDSGGRKSGLTWRVLGTWAKGSPDFFAAYVRDPKTKNPNAQMPGNPGYDSETLRALTDYFRTFAHAETAP